MQLMLMRCFVPTFNTLDPQQQAHMCQITCSAPKANASLTAPRSGGGPRQIRAAVWCHDRCRCSTALGVRSLMLTARCSYCTTCSTHPHSSPIHGGCRIWSPPMRTVASLSPTALPAGSYLVNPCGRLDAGSARQQCRVVHSHHPAALWRRCLLLANLRLLQQSRRCCHCWRQKWPLRPVCASLGLLLISAIARCDDDAHGMAAAASPRTAARIVAQGPQVLTSSATTGCSAYPPAHTTR